MNDREKLIALIREGNGGYDFASVERIADHLIDNGVTIQRWIPVEERLPEPFVSVLVHMPIEEPMPTVREGFLSQAGEWYCGLYRRDTGIVTHWMPLPQPPIEEQNRSREGDNDG